MLDRVKMELLLREIVGKSYIDHEYVYIDLHLYVFIFSDDYQSWNDFHDDNFCKYMKEAGIDFYYVYFIDRRKEERVVNKRKRGILSNFISKNVDNIVSVFKIISTVSIIYVILHKEGALLNYTELLHELDYFPVVKLVSYSESLEESLQKVGTSLTLS